MVPALGDGLGTHRGGALSAVCRGAYRGGDQTGVSGDSGAARAPPPRPRPRTGAGALAGRCAGVGAKPRDVLAGLVPAISGLRIGVWTVDARHAAARSRDDGLLVGLA